VNKFILILNPSQKFHQSSKEIVLGKRMQANAKQNSMLPRLLRLFLFLREHFCILIKIFENYALLMTN